METKNESQGCQVVMGIGREPREERDVRGKTRDDLAPPKASVPWPSSIFTRHNQDPIQQSIVQQTRLLFPLIFPIETYLLCFSVGCRPSDPRELFKSAGNLS